MEIICNRLIKTYNTNILDNTSKRISKEFFDASIANRGGDKGRQVLIDLIYNHYTIKKQQVAFIGGPKTFTSHWSDKYEKIIYIFGELHSYLMDCDDIDGFKEGDLIIPIEDYLYDLILNTDVFIDIYFEFPAYMKDKKEYGSEFKIFPTDLRLNNLLNKFKKCLQYTTRAAKECKLARVHYFDVRYQVQEGFKEGVNEASWFMKKISVLVTGKQPRNIKAKNIRDTMENDHRFKRVFNTLNSSIIEEFEEFWINDIKYNSYVLKEIDKIKEDSNMKVLIFAFIEKEITKLTIEKKDKLSRFLNDILESRPVIDDKYFIHAFTIVCEILQVFNALVADVYTLARIFKDFNMNDIEEKGYIGATDQPTRAHNIIIYGGDRHARLYREFFKSIGFKQIEESGKSGKEFTTCLDMRKIKPLFSEWPLKKSD